MVDRRNFKKNKCQTANVSRYLFNISVRFLYSETAEARSSVVSRTNTRNDFNIWQKVNNLKRINRKKCNYLTNVMTFRQIKIKDVFINIESNY